MVAPSLPTTDEDMSIRFPIGKTIGAIILSLPFWGRLSPEHTNCPPHELRHNILGIILTFPVFPRWPPLSLITKIRHRHRFTSDSNR